MHAASVTVRAVITAVAVLVTVGAISADAAPRVTAKVIAITDGDTLRAEIVTSAPALAASEKVRLVGIDCPELAQVPWGRVATTRLVLGQRVELEVAPRSRDRYGRLLASLWLDGQLVQTQLVREGLCLPYVLPPNVEHAEVLRTAAAEARTAGRGLYGVESPLTETPSAYRQRGRVLGR